AAAAYQGGLLLSQGDQRKAHCDHFRRRLDLCQTFGIPTLVLVADFAQAVDPQSLGRAVVSLAQAAQWAAGFGVTLALEFRGTDTFCTCLDTGLALVGPGAGPVAAGARRGAGDDLPPAAAGRFVGRAESPRPDKGVRGSRRASTGRPDLQDTGAALRRPSPVQLVEADVPAAEHDADLAD